jgi:lipopolysaccharide export system permease protein
MGILARHIVLEILGLFFPIWAALGFLLFVLEWLAQVFRLKADALTVLMLYAYKAPSHLQIVFPLAMLLAVMIVVGGMNRNLELVAAQSLGITKSKILAICFLAWGVGAVAQGFVMNNLAPWGMRRHYETMDADVNQVPSRFSQIRQEKIWYRNKDILYNVHYYDPQKNELFDVTIYTFDDNFQIAQTIYANKAEWDGRQWVLTNGRVNLTDKSVANPSSQAFKIKNTRLIENPKSLKRIEFNAETMSEQELYRAIERHRALGINTAEWEVTFHSRLSFFLVSIVFLLLGFALSHHFTRGGGLAKDAGLVAGVSMVYWLLFNFSSTLGNNGKLNPILASWGPSVLFLVCVAAYLRFSAFKLDHR